MKNKEIEFNAIDLIHSIEQVRDHVAGKQKLTMRNTKMILPAPVKSLKPRDIRAIRERLKLSQSVFASLLNVPTNTEISWEKGRRHPTGTALRLLDIVQRKPEAFWKLLAT